jgi:secreted PhoX family phosphatase
MVPGMTAENDKETMTDVQIRGPISATGISILEVARIGADWAVVTDSP